MEPDTKRIIPINIEEEMKSSYIDYSMSVIVSRALPDVRDGLKPVHRRVLYGMSELGLSAGAAYKKSARIVGECFVAGTQVLTEHGLKPIEAVKRGERVYTQSGQAPVTELYEMPPRDLLKITLENGLSVTVTPSQPIKVLNEHLAYVWKAARDLTPEDHVVLRADYPDDLPCVQLPEWEGQPVTLDEDLAYLLGLFLSDGWISKSSGRFGFYSTSPGVIKRVGEALEHVFGYEARVENRAYVHPKQGDDAEERAAFQIRINAGALNQYLSTTFGIAPSTLAATKQVPAQILRSPRPVLAAFLSGLFDGDGSVHAARNQVHYGTVSEALAEGVHLLLFHLGVLTKRIKQPVSKENGSINGRPLQGRYPSIALEANGRYAQRLGTLLDLAHEDKRARLERICASQIKVNKYDRVPYAAPVLFGELSEHHREGGWYEDAQGQPFHNLHYLRVATVAPAPAEKTYDLQVAGVHEFVANGIISHNCLGKYHPHGDSAVYDTMVRMAQTFSMRYPLVDGQGNFGSIDGDSAAAMRYTEARMTRLAEEMLRDINKNTVDYQENFDGSLEEPTVLPAALPNLLLNGSDGIAVGMATKIPPHNLGEVVEAVVATIDDPAIELDGLLQHLPAPDFPTGGIIYGYGGVKQAYHTGRGRVIMRAKFHEEEIRKDRLALIVTEIPYQVNKSSLIEKIAHLVREKRIEGISDLRDESDRDGMRIVIELKRDALPLVVQNQLYKYTPCQQTFGVNMVALVAGRPRTLTLKEMITHYIDHRHEVVVRRTEYDLAKAEERAHILEGLKIALDHLDAVISIIRHSEDTDAAKRNLMAGVFPTQLTPQQRQRLGLPTHNESMFTLSEAQADAILALRLSRLTGLERQKIEQEYRDILKEIERLQSILASRELRMQIVKNELLELKAKYNDERRTQIDYSGGDIIIEDLIEDEQVAVTITHQGLIKRTPITEYRSQGRGGVGMKGLGTRDDDYVEHLFVSSNHDYLLFFTDDGQCYWLRVFEIPEGSRTAKGRSIRNLIQIAPDDRVRAVLAISKPDFEDEDFLNNHYVVMATRQGQVKKTVLEAFSRPRVDGIIAIDIVEGDDLLEARLTDGEKHVIIAASSGRSVRFHESDARPMGRNTRGVRGIQLGKREEAVGMVVVDEDDTSCILAVSANGYGKRSALDEYRVQGRGGKGIITMKTTSKTGRLVAIKSVEPEDDLMIVTENGLMIRMNVDTISVQGRNTQGVKLLRLKGDDAIADVTRLVVDDEEDKDEAAQSDGAAMPEPDVEVA